MTGSDEAELPPISFDRPPVTEVAYAVQFKGQAIDLEVLGGIAANVKGGFPRREQHPPLPPMVEDFGLPPASPQIVFQTAPDLPRTWFVSADGSRLIQAQGDRFAFNWRRLEADQPYPRYAALRRDFVEQLAPVVDAVRRVNPVAAALEYVELTYVNELLAGDAMPRGPHPLLSRFLRWLSPIEGEFLREPEDSQLQARWRIPRQDGSAVGRLYMAANPAFRRDEMPVYVLTMTARLRVDNSELDAVIGQLDTAHLWILHAFRDLTTPEMHETWGLRTEDTK
jgi:uncharacterized protein (TIGR04255 family)